MNTQRKHEILNELDTAKKQVELLDSYRTLGMANDEQYAESILRFISRVSELEKESGVDYDTSVNGKLNFIYEKLEDVQKSLNELKAMYEEGISELDA